MRLSRMLKTAVAIVAASGLAMAVAVSAGAEPRHGLSRPATCTGSVGSPGVLAGTYTSNVVVTGVCFVNGGAAKILGDLIIAPTGALNATFALNDVAGTGTSSLTVKHDVIVQPGGVLVMGCEPNFSQCQDDTDTNGGVLTGQDHVYGSLFEFAPLGVVVHASTINGSVTELGGGGGVTCTPSGVFAAFHSPVYSDYEDNTINGNLTVIGLQTCWLGSLRNTVGGSIIDIKNTMADPDAGEVLQNTVYGNIACFGNSPAVQYGDSGASPNVVSGHAFGQCGFNVISPDPNYPNGDGTGGPQPISVKAI